jgi:hypothetical protein
MLRVELKVSSGLLAAAVVVVVTPVMVVRVVIMVRELIVIYLALVLEMVLVMPWQAPDQVVEERMLVCHLFPVIEQEMVVPVLFSLHTLPK